MTGTTFWKEKAPEVSRHGAIGRSDEAHIGCSRKDSSVVLMVEAVIAEITGIEARKAVNRAPDIAMRELWERYDRPPLLGPRRM